MYHLVPEYTEWKEVLEDSVPPSNINTIMKNYIISKGTTVYPIFDINKACTVEIKRDTYWPMYCNTNSYYEKTIVDWRVSENFLIRRPTKYDLDIVLFSNIKDNIIGFGVNRDDMKAEITVSHNNNSHTITISNIDIDETGFSVDDKCISFKGLIFWDFR